MLSRPASLTSRRFWSFSARLGAVAGLLLGGLPVSAQGYDEAPAVAPSTLYRRSGLGFEYVRRDYVEGDQGTGFTVLFGAEPLAIRTPMGGGAQFGVMAGGGIGFGAVRRQLPGDTVIKSFVLRRYELSGLAGFDVPLGSEVRAGVFGGLTTQGVLTTFEKNAAFVRVRLNTRPARLEANALLTNQTNGSLHLYVPIPTEGLLRGTVAFGFHATRYQTDRSGVINLFGFSINAMDL